LLAALEPQSVVVLSISKSHIILLPSDEKTFQDRKRKYIRNFVQLITQLESMMKMKMVTKSYKQKNIFILLLKVFEIIYYDELPPVVLESDG